MTPGELAAENARTLRRAIAIWNPVFAAAFALDLLVASAHVDIFAMLRIVATTINFMLLPLLARPRGHERATALFAVWFLVWGASTAPMLLLAGPSLLVYALVLAVVLHGVGVVPLWPMHWCGPVVAVIALSAVVPLVLASGTLAPDDVALAIAIIVANAIFAVTTASSRYALAISGRRAISSDELASVHRAAHSILANVSSDLRAPVPLILAPLQQLLDEPQLVAYRPTLAMAMTNTHRLSRHIDDLLELSRLEAGGLRLNLADIDLRALADTVVEGYQEVARERQVELVMLAGATPSGVVADAQRLETVLSILVEAALDRTPTGRRVTVEVADEPTVVAITVRDQGDPIPANGLAHLFDAVGRAKHRGDERRRGASPRTALAKGLLELHGGELAAWDDVGSGTAVTVRLRRDASHYRPEVIERRKQFVPDPANARRIGDRVIQLSAVDALPEETFPPRTPSPGAELAASDDRARVLVVEDSDELRAFIRRILQPSFDVTEAFDGEDGWEQAESTLPDLVLSDVMMPRLSGTDLCRRIKQHAVLRTTPVILLTARTGAVATLDAYAHGADDFVAKPFHPRVLLARVRAHLRIRQLALQVIAQEKLAAIGTLAAGVAHEVRNPINAIVNAARLLQAKAPAIDAARPLTDVIVDGAQRIADIASALDAHARPADAGGAAPVDLGAGLDATLRLLAHRLDGVTLHRDYRTADLALGSPGAINQVLLNLVDNAVRSGARTLWLSVDRAGDRVVARVADDGPGVPEGIEARIFDPFFTTREPGQGRGLGLYLSRRIAREHGGDLRVERRAGGGAAFVLALPAETFAAGATA